jgi:LysM repeat protein
VYPHLNIWRPVTALGALVATAVLATSSVTVAAGDTLSQIAERHDVTVAELVEWNNIDDPDRIFSGTTLIVSAPQDAIASADSGEGVHVVTAGETLFAIASRLQTTIARLVADNALADPDRIFVGQRLNVSGISGVSSAANTSGGSDPGPDVSTVPASGRTHIVVAGDSLGAIASRYGIDTTALARDNNIADPDLITIGMTLTIGESAPTPTTTVAPAPTTTGAPTPSTPVETSPVIAVPQQRDGEVLLVPLFARWSDVYDVPQDLLEAIAWKESSWRPDVVGPAGHLGLTQLSPATVELIEGGLLGRDMNPLDPEDGMQLAARYLRYLLDRTDNEREATAAWIQGLSSVQRDGVTAVGADYARAVEEIRRIRR